MSPVIRISNSLHKRLEKRAIGFDTPANVIEKLLNQAEGLKNFEESQKNELSSPLSINLRPEDPEIFKNELLPINLIPADPEIFKNELLKRRRAIIVIQYQNGRIEKKAWNVSRFKKDSNVLGNLRSRSEFRQGFWQKQGIKDVLVKIV